ncbi:MAG TPA: 4-alpha-glucanotransferase [Gemmatimonadales bacterium]|nr:4-alpha-glucanotransferase [Gemmatimonadales bacterium]
MTELAALHALAQALGVHTEYVDGLARPVSVSPETLVRIAAALGAPISRPAEAGAALRAVEDARRDLVPPVLVAWNGALEPVKISAGGAIDADLALEDGGRFPLEIRDGAIHATGALPSGYHRLAVGASGETATATVISAPLEAWRRPGTHRSWGVGAQLAALRSARSRALGDLRDLESLCRWVRERGGDVVTALPLLPTFNSPPAEPSPYSPVSRLFWSELMMDLGDGTRATPPPATLDVTRGDVEVRAALGGRTPDPSLVDDELARYARFRGAQAKLGRNWRDWPAPARGGELGAGDVDAAEERFHLVAQTEVRRQLRELRGRLDPQGMRLGLDLAVGVHPDGYDPWSRQPLFGDGISVGAPPDAGFPSGQDWGFSPVLPEASRREGHRYIAASIAHQASLAGVLRVDHIMALRRLYWIPRGMGLHQGTYVTYPAKELFAVLALESHRHACEVVGENLGNVPAEINQALDRHRIWGMYLAQFQSPLTPELAPPSSRDMALVGTHDTPTFAGWIAGNDIVDRVRYGLLKEEDAAAVREERDRATRWLAERMGCTLEEPRAFFAALLEWLGRSESPLVVPWLEDLWLEPVAVNLPGTPSSTRPNWRRPMGRLLDAIVADPELARLLDRLHRARNPDR